MNGTAKGLNWKQNSFYSTATPWFQNGYTGNIYTNYKSKINELSLQGIFTLNNIRFHRAKTGINFYALVGISGMTYDTKVNALKDGGGNYQAEFNSIAGNVYENRKDTKSDLKDALDDSYESQAETHGDTRPKMFDDTFKPAGTLGGGIAYKINNRFNIALEDRVVFAKDDLIDGQQWAEQGDLTRDYDSYNYLTLGLNYNIGAKAVEPLYWLNPLDYAYSEIRNPRLMRLPKTSFCLTQTVMALPISLTRNKPQQVYRLIPRV
jgi:hypothetical protein